MRTVVLIILILSAALSNSQTEYSGINVSIEMPLPEKITVILKAGSDSLNHCKVQIIDSKKNTVKTVDLPPAMKQIESSIAIWDLGPGNYTCLVYKGNVELYKKEFFKDAIFAEPQHELTPYKTPD